jgi:two-component system KDP operon response regulator KdpE
MSPTTLPAPQRTVLLVEDDEATRDALTALLAHEGYLVLPAASGREALRVLAAPLAPVDVALLDIRLPDISGIDVCAHLRALATGIPVVACSGEAASAEVARLLDLGVRRYFAKPIAAAELLATLDAILHDSDPSAIN